MLSFERRFEVKIFTLEGEVHMEGARQRSWDLYFLRFHCLFTIQKLFLPALQLFLPAL